ncbi:MAG: endo alpha-1,4 polygalactosaminidase [Anaerolineae bacterium]|nr:endo alpha-1,4 polygalactosaminidase [Anaerolineae bacterium]
MEFHILNKRLITSTYQRTASGKADGAAILFACFVLSALILASCVPTRPVEHSLLDETPVPSTNPQVTADPPRWIPSRDILWQIQFDGDLDLGIPADLYDLDLFETDTAAVAALHAQGRRVICYLNAGAWEDWRPDADQFPSQVIGNDYAGWPGEKWLDIRRLALLAPILRARLDLCAAKGFDGVDPDNVDGYTNATGFPLTAADQLAFNRWLAGEAHARGLAIGLKNDPEQARDLVADFDWALTEDCFVEDWCADLTPFLEAGKPILAIEYTDRTASLAPFCTEAQRLGISPILKHRDLDAFREVCR